MRRLVSWTVVIVCLVGLDTVAFHGTYTSELLRQGQATGQAFQHVFQDWANFITRR